ncbi:MAG: tetratricopeptide repeat protein [Chlamydiota bacterium]
MSLSDEFARIAEFLANAQADELEIKKGLMTPRSKYVEEKSASIKQEMEEQYAKMLRRMSSVGVILEQELNQLPQIEKDHHMGEISFAMKRLLQCKASPDELAKETKLLEANIWQDFLAFSDETLLWIYKIGYRYSEEKKSEEAKALFQLLVMLNPQVSDYWVALGFVERQLSEETEALDAFSMASILNPENPVSRYQSAEIYLQRGELEDALVELDVLAEIIEKSKLDSLRSELEQLRSKVRSKQLL